MPWESRRKHQIHQVTSELAMPATETNMFPVTMRLEFDVTTALSPEAVHTFFKTPSDWPRLFPAFREARLRRDGWTAVPIRRSPIPLLARNTAVEPHRIAWDLRGFWKGDGEVQLEAVAAGTRVTGYEQIDVARLLGVGRLIEQWAEPRFALVWESGWARLRKMRPGQDTS